MLVNLVGDHQEIGRHGEFGQCAQLVIGGHHAGRIVWRIEDQRLGLRRHRPPQALDIDREAQAVGPQRNRPSMAAGHRDHRGVRVVERLDQQHLGAGFDEPEHRGRDGLGGTHRHEYLGVRVVLGAVSAPALVGDSLTKRRDAQAWRVLIDSLRDGVLGGCEHRRWTILVGEPLSEVHCPYPGGQRRHLGEDGHRVWLQPAHRHSGRA